MSVYFVVTYDVSNPEEFAKYVPGSMPVILSTVAKHGGEIVVAGGEHVQVAGEERHVRVIMKFPNKEAVLAWDNDPEYAEAKAIREASTTNVTAFIVDQFTLPNS